MTVHGVLLDADGQVIARDAALTYEEPPLLQPYQVAWLRGLGAMTEAVHEFSATVRATGQALTRWVRWWNAVLRRDGARLRRLDHPHHAYTGQRHRGTRKCTPLVQPPTGALCQSWWHGHAVACRSYEGNGWPGNGQGGLYARPAAPPPPTGAPKRVNRRYSRMVHDTWG